jgi:hypothetical protein
MALRYAVTLHVCTHFKGQFTHTMPFPCRDPATTLPLPCYSPTVPNAGRSPTCRVWTADANSHIPCRSPTANLPWPWEVAFRTDIRGMAGERQGNGMACVNQTRPRCINQMGKTQSKPLAKRHSRGTAWELHGMCESAFRGRHRAARASVSVTD